MLIPREKLGDTALLFECKLSKTPKDLKDDAQKALAQIEQMSYDARIAEFPYVLHVIKIGIAFCGKQMELLYTPLDKGAPAK